MLSCRACFRRCLQALDTPAAESLFQPSRTRAVYTSSRNAKTTQVDGVIRYGHDPWKNSEAARDQKRRERAALRESPAQETVTPNLEKLGHRDPSVSPTEWSNRKKELRYLQDPLELAGFVKNELSKGRSQEMLQLVHMASRSMQCIVSWNHIIDHYLAHEKVRDALKVYNDMKKRAQFPDSYTYTILLRGLSINAHNPEALAKALAIYHSLSAPNSRVEPSIIHTNAVLRVCARARDMDALWGIAGKIPETGPASANKITYITILNALRQDVLDGLPSGETEGESEAAARKERGVVEGRRVWEEIVAKWRAADLRIDEELVCSMGRLLLIGARPHDWDDVLSLIEQTMDIPRFVPRLGSPERQLSGEQRLRAPNVVPEFRFADDHLSPDGAPKRGDEFAALEPQGVAAVVSNPLVYVRPGNNTLSLIQEACQKTVVNAAAQKYWDVLTDPGVYNVVPDLNNLHMRLRVLRLNRASTAAVKLLEEDLLARGMQPVIGTFRIIASTCVRDKNNHNSLKNAGKVLQIMLEKLEDADVKVVGMYAELALRFPLATASDLIDSLTILNPLVKNIRLQLGIGSERRDGRGITYLRGEERHDATQVLRKVYGVYDKLLNSNMLPEEQKAPFKVERARLSSFLARVMYKGQTRNPISSRDHRGDADLHSYLGEDEQGVEQGRGHKVMSR